MLIKSQLLKVGVPLLTQWFRHGRQGQMALASNLVNFHGAEAELDEAIQSPDKKVLYFTATWCPPCRMIAPVFQSMSEEFSSIKFLKIDIDEYGDTASSFNIQSVPTFIFMKGGEIQSKFSGASKENLRASLMELQK